MPKRRLLVGLLVVFAFGLIAAGCGDDEGDATTPTEIEGATEDAQDLTDQAQEALENAPQDVDEAVEQCKQGVEDSGLEGDQKQNALDLCDSSGEAAQEALENAEGLQDALGE